ncbi:transposase of IS5377-like element [Fictibacillus macauensis ZFHKF-1]|uniref:Transposase of IS5377-like element n=1 Tax=Fictibacillus macauensis ZFHKF-1 TaxID=1196324 RepID=I8IW60_9BACL|nr:hypothetical protein [Fictibacillus macauensis]EIT83726.1 transposase of IS5377-like element [Fictibacillus macauensis ZFHKF-1]
MTKHTTTHALIQNFLSEEELQEILAVFNFKETARKCTVSMLLAYLLEAATHEWKSLRYAADVGPSGGLTAVDHSSLSIHIKALDYAIMKRIFQVLVGS